MYIEYFEVVEDALSTYTPDCVKQIKHANEMINVLIKTNEGAKQIEKKFKYLYTIHLNLYLYFKLLYI